MKLKVKEVFKDKYTDKVYNKDEIIEVSEERGQELLKSPYVEEVKEVEEVKTDYSKIKKEDLIKIATEKGIEVSEDLKKEEIVTLIEQFDNLPKE